MKENIITISDNGSVYVPTNAQMRDFEIAELFGVMIPTIRSHVRAILKTGIATDDYTNGAILVGCNILPDYYGLDMITALAFRIQSWQAKVVRQWILSKAVEKEKEEPQISFSIGTKPIDRFIN